MLKVLGNGYVLQHFLQELKRRRRREALEIYITDALYCVGNDKCMTKRFYDLVGGADRRTDNRSSSEIIEHMLSLFE